MTLDRLNTDEIAFITKWLTTALEQQYYLDGDFITLVRNIEVNEFKQLANAWCKDDFQACDLLTIDQFLLFLTHYPTYPLKISDAERKQAKLVREKLAST